jgi:hypothetical protein
VFYRSTCDFFTRFRKYIFENSKLYVKIYLAVNIFFCLTYNTELQNINKHASFVFTVVP